MLRPLMSFQGRKPLTRVVLTAAGRAAFAACLEALSKLVERRQGTRPSH